MSSSSSLPQSVTGAHVPFPVLRVQSLVGRTLLLPAELPAPTTLVVCAFHRSHQRPVDAWIAWAVESAGVAPSPAGLDPDARSVVVEIPVIGRGYRPFRRVIDGGMATGIGDPVVLARTLTAYTEVRAFVRAAGIATTRTVSALVVRRDGEVLAHVTGPPDPARCDVVRAALPGPDPEG